MLSLFSSEKLYIDIRGRLMKFAQAKFDRRTGNVEIKKFGSIHFPADASENGLLIDDVQTVKVVSNFIKKEKITARDVNINISDPSIVLRIVKLPLMPESDLRDYLDMEIGQYLPIDLETSVYDYKVLGQVEEDDRKLLSLILISVPKDLIRNYENIFRKAGLNPVAIDVYPNSIARVFAGEVEKDIAVVDINENAVDFVIMEKGKLFMYSNMTLENVFSFYGKEGTKAERLAEEDGVFSSTIFEITNYIRTYMNFFSSRHFGKNVDMIYILGELSLVENIDVYLSEMLQVEVVSGLPASFRVVPKMSTYNLDEYKKNQYIDKRFSIYSGILGLVLRGA